MSLPSQYLQATGWSFPRSRGDEPKRILDVDSQLKFSPLTRG